MVECRSCKQDIHSLDVRRMVEQEGVLENDQFEIAHESIAEDRFYCPACHKLLFMHHVDAECFLAEDLERAAELYGR